MKHVERETNQSSSDNAIEQDHNNKHENLGWARKYLDLADQAMTSNPGESSEQR